ncbi:hypothetical protein [Longimicrobium terrae]|uniref:Spore coat protein CotH n=1 Tax=Longimicrobium terrae TaxID=1639882 RepID=A0A841H4P3_9BACT|nr:hypothetical protein [Longimicrobium terrae]MBB4638672.1 spore coat protein CotH [Longimicrobium terrae]MBB6072912.1 spore coat protein CotH [Longimicrobium terrae]NNC31525.1 hypothetical protein [Longimicrobium terrae]
MENNDRTNVDGHPEVAAQDRLNMQPGRLEDIENASAYANRIGQTDVTGERPASSQGEQMHDRDDMSAREGMADLTGNPVERGERQAGTGGGADRVTPGEDIGSGIRAKPADGVQDNDGRVSRGEDIGNGVRARGADEQDPGNPLV